jgi:all-trans-8'-apo-beta-carotenal 15,15'-oxygenase
MHDFVLTERYAVFFATPVRFDVARAMSGMSSPVEAIRRDPREPTEVILVPRDGGPVRRVRAPDGFFIFHFFNGFEDGEAVVVDGCRMPDFPGGTIDLRDPEQVRAAPFEPAQPTRWIIEADRVASRPLGDVPMELPTVDPRRKGHRAAVGWATAMTRRGAGPLYTALARLDLETGEARVKDLAPDLPGEPLFVPESAEAEEGRGWLLSVVYRADERRSELWVLRADSLETVARFALPHHLPPGFHGTFVPA